MDLIVHAMEQEEVPERSPPRFGATTILQFMERDGSSTSQFSRRWPTDGDTEQNCVVTGESGSEERFTNELQLERNRNFDRCAEIVDAIVMFGIQRRLSNDAVSMLRAVGYGESYEAIASLIVFALLQSQIERAPPVEEVMAIAQMRDIVVSPIVAEGSYMASFPSGVFTGNDRDSLAAEDVANSVENQIFFGARSGEVVFHTMADMAAVGHTDPSEASVLWAWGEVDELAEQISIGGPLPEDVVTLYEWQPNQWVADAGSGFRAVLSDRFIRSEYIQDAIEFVLRADIAPEYVPREFQFLRASAH